MNITKAKYFKIDSKYENSSIDAVIDNENISIPIDAGNRHYQAILEWVAEGNTIEEADGLTWDDIRAKRDGILTSTDWTMTTGATVDLSLIHI